MRFELILLLPEAVLLFFFVAPLFCGVRNLGNVAGILACVVAILLTIFARQVGRGIQALWRHIAGKIGICVVVICILALAVFCITMWGQMLSAAHNTTDASYTLVVLGSKIYGDTLSDTLTQRLETALVYLEEHPETLCVVAGGVTEDATAAEADLMSAWLIEHGIDESRILVENTSTDTSENMRNTAQLLEENGLDKTVIVVTDAYHQYRASLYAADNGMTTYALNAETNPLYVPVYWVREWIGLLEYWLLYA